MDEEDEVCAYVCACTQACVLSHTSHIWLFATPWIIAHQTTLSMEFSRKEYWSGLPYPPPDDLPGLEIEPASPATPPLAGRLITEPWGKPIPFLNNHLKIFVLLRWVPLKFPPCWEQVFRLSLQFLLTPLLISLISNEMFLLSSKRVTNGKLRPQIRLPKRFLFVSN